MSTQPNNTPTPQSGSYMQPQYPTMPQQQSRGRGNGYSIFVTILLLLALAGIGGMVYRYYKKVKEFSGFLQDKQMMIDSLNDSASASTDVVETLELQLEELQDVYPMIATKLEVANVDYNSNILTGYGSSIYSSSTMYLQPRITYSANESLTVTLYVKLFRISGDTYTLCTGSSSPSGYSYKQDVTLSEGGQNTIALMGWGSSTKGHWNSGNYRFEVWYDDVCLAVEDFKIY